MTLGPKPSDKTVYKWQRQKRAKKSHLVYHYRYTVCGKRIARPNYLPTAEPPWCRKCLTGASLNPGNDRQE